MATSLQSLQADLNALQTRYDAQLKTMEADYNESLDTIWMLLAGMLVFFMHAGFSLLESGCVRLKNAQNILAKNLIVVTLGFLCWYIVGWPLAYGVTDGNPNKFMGLTQFAMDQFWPTKELFRNWFFQGAFCATACTIVSGAMAERTQLKGFATYSIIMTSIIYPIVVYWGWSGSGWLLYTEGDESKSTVGPAYMDFAGSGLVHLVGGVGAICGAIIVGPRNGRWEKDKENDFAAHNIPFCVLGTFCLWFGWYGFNPGSTLAMHTASSATTAGLVAVNTTLAPCVAGLLVFVARTLQLGLLDVGGFCNGILAGLVSITAGCAFVKPWEAIIIGLIGGVVYVGASFLMKMLKIDDVVDAFAVHGACGLWGITALGLFGNPDDGMGGNGLLHTGKLDQLGVELLGGFVIIVWVASLSLLIFVPLKLLGALRLSDDFQNKGADFMEHSPRKAYAQEQKEQETQQDAI
jgi:Amt family ammonium transporter